MTLVNLPKKYITENFLQNIIIKSCFRCSTSIAKSSVISLIQYKTKIMTSHHSPVFLFDNVTATLLVSVLRFRYLMASLNSMFVFILLFITIKQLRLVEEHMA